MAASTGAVIAATSLAAGLKLGVTQKAAKGDIGGAVAGAGDKLLGLNQPKAPQAIAPTPSNTNIPTVNQESIQKARAARLATLQRASGRASTLLTNRFGG